MLRKGRPISSDGESLRRCSLGSHARAEGAAGDLPARGGGRRRLSVHAYGREEVQDLLDELAPRARQGFPYGLSVYPPERLRPKDTDAAELRVDAVAWALTAAWCGNVAAWLATYALDGHDSHAEQAAEIVRGAAALEARADHLPKRAALPLARDLGLLLYNCVSNGGTDFCPAEARAIIESIRYQLAEQAAEAKTGEER